MLVVTNHRVIAGDPVSAQELTIQSLHLRVTRLPPTFYSALSERINDFSVSEDGDEGGAVLPPADDTRRYISAVLAGLQS